MAPLVEIEAVRYAYSDDGPEILHGLDLTIEEGEYLALIGQNGSGKTTLSKLIGGLNTPTSGDVRIQGKSVKDMSVQERASRLPVLPSVPVRVLRAYYLTFPNTALYSPVSVLLSEQAMPVFRVPARFLLFPLLLSPPCYFPYSLWLSDLLSLFLP